MHAAEVRDALRRGELHLVYQPQVLLSSGEIVAMEALLRWTRPGRGPAGPAEFLPIAEESGLIDEIGARVLDEACATAAGWRRDGLPPVRLMVNVSARQLQDPGFAAGVERALARHGLDARRLGIELTETALMEDPGDAAAQLARLRAAGVEIALDDFGTGCSSLACLARLPVDTVKIDRSLMPAVTGNGDALALTRAIIAMAQCLGLKVVAEGVETEAQLEVLAANRCDAFQGHHFSAPLPAAQAQAMLRSGRRMPVLARRLAERQLSVVVVDDEPWVVERLRQQLPWRFGDRVRVETCTDPRAAMNRLRQGRVDVIACDLLMPELDGIALLTRARTLQPSAVRMMLLGPQDLVRVVDDPRQVDVFRYLSKPWTGDQLLAHFGAALDQADRERAAHALSESLEAAALPSAAALELLSLEAAEPGLTAVARSSLDEVLLPSQLMTLPGDLWALDTLAGTPAASRA